MIESNLNSDVGESSSKIILDEGNLTAWQCTPAAPIIKSAQQDRKWMDESDQRFAYRCLPLVIANSFGYDVLNPVTFSAYWTGGKAPQDVKIHWPTSQTVPIPQAHFGSGVLTFTLGHLFQTPPGINLYVKGPPNEPKDGILALEGVVETDWCPATFTMNWLFTRPNHQVIFTAGESYCRIFPIPRYMTEIFTPILKNLENNPGLHQYHLDWRRTRDEFNKGLRVPGSEYTKRKWQKEYFQGGGLENWPKFDQHQTKLHQKEFRDYRSDVYKQQDLIPRKSLKPVVLKNLEGIPFTVLLDNHEEEEFRCPYQEEK